MPRAHVRVDRDSRPLSDACVVDAARRDTEMIRMRRAACALDVAEPLAHATFLDHISNSVGVHADVERASDIAQLVRPSNTHGGLETLHVP